jgi:hypothetical protein
MVFFIFIIGSYRTIDAVKYSNINADNVEDPPFFLPFNSHIADQSIHKKDSHSIIPFP